ncbi:hypothetical protein GCM10010300_45620 [Streptomyces olivaceoviridis]|nr:hypothetical protein GCM10010300_45620 [Streptomyces olivaceoviridis]
MPPFPRLECRIDSASLVRVQLRIGTAHRGGAERVNARPAEAVGDRRLPPVRIPSPSVSPGGSPVRVADAVAAPAVPVRPVCRGNANGGAEGEGDAGDEAVDV